VDPYRLYVLNLLGLGNREALAYSSIPGLGLEDFLWGQLWFICWSRALGNISRSFHKSLTAAGGGMVLHQNTFLKAINAGENHLFELVMGYGGKEHFDAEGNNSFQYASILMCCQRFGDAISYLWSTGHQSFVAVHLLVLCLHYGLVRPDVPLVTNPPHPLLQAAMRKSGTLGSNNATDAAMLAPVALLRTFLSSFGFMQHRSDIALDYFISIDLGQSWNSHVELLNVEHQTALRLKCQNTTSSALEAFLMSLSREQLCKLTGNVLGGGEQSDTGSGNMSAAVTPWRSRGCLDDYLPATQVEQLLSRCAYSMLSVRRDVDSAIYLYELAGRHVDALEEMARQLSEHLMKVGEVGVASGVDSERSYWYKLSAQHCAQHLQADSAVARSIMNAGAQSSIDTFFALLRLYLFVDLCADGSTLNTIAGVESALSILDDLNWIPSSVAQVGYASCPSASLLRAVQDDMLLLAMHCTHTEFFLTKSHPGASAALAGVFTTAEQTLRRLKDRAKAIVEFAYKVKSRLNRDDTLSRLIGAEAALV
jgi:hypothetical protein